ncbi:F-box only protein 36 isoform X5 [Ursus arctos]|uniref:F-box only protein 36 isoform X5 n=1 Tax=Ursus arctos TaxID=9644 RepID=UPI002548E6CF|nr:F-box only protein 36 isoform X5 [Ursus arctos]
MASWLPETLFEIVGQGPAPSKDYYQLLVTRSQVIFRWWKISLRSEYRSTKPGEAKESHEEFLDNSHLQELSVLSPRYVLLNIDDVTPMSRRWQTASMLWRDLCMQGGGDELRKNGEACRLSKLPKTPRLRSTSYHKKAATALCGSFLIFKVRIQLSVLLHVPPVVSGAQLLVGTVL